MGMTLTPDTLTHWLRTAGSLPMGEVERVDIDLEVSTTVSTLTFVRVAYSDRVTGNLPTSLVVKQALGTSTAPNVAPAEVDFYRRLAPMLGSPPLVRCLAAISGGTRDRDTLVLEDLRASHDHRAWPLPPTASQADGAIDALAAVHAQWWEHGELGVSIGTLHTTKGLTGMVNSIATLIPGFLDSLGSDSPDASAIYERVFTSALRPWLRLTEPRALTVTHGDAHSWNFLFPRSGEGPAFVYDWQLWHVDVGARDLAFFIGLHWPAELRRARESATLRRYHEQIEARGVGGYGIDELMVDYRRGIVRNLTFPLFLWKRGLSREAWVHRLAHNLAAYRELGCDEVL